MKRSVKFVFEPGSANALATLTEIDYETPGENNSAAATDPTYFAHLNAIRQTSYNFVGVSGSDAKTITDWQSIESLFVNTPKASISEKDYSYDPNYRQHGIIGLPVETRQMDPANPAIAIARSQTIYDNALASGYPYTIQSYANIGASMDCSSDPQHPDICWQNPNGTGSPDLSYRGLPTTIRVYNADGNGHWIETHTQYDQFGNPVKKMDAAGNEATTVFDSQYKYAYPISITAPAPDPTNTHGTNATSTSSTTYDFTTGLPLSITDDFGQVTTTEYDAELRPFRVNPIVVNGEATGPKTETVYGVPDANGQLTSDQRFVKVRKQLDATNWDQSTTWFDALGRTIKTQAKDSQGDVFVETHYDAFGRVDRVTNPYRAGDTIYWSKTRYDAAGRAVETYAPATQSDIDYAETHNNSNLTSLGITSFDISPSVDVGTVVTTTDASLRKSRSITNALGQLIRVDEATAVGGTETNDLGSLASPNQPTYYKYDAYGKMVQVTQGVQNRYFKYDSLGRLIRVNQPEQDANSNFDLADSFNTGGHWTAAFVYDDLGNVLRATDANGVNIINEYDKANRVTQRCYTKPNVNTTATTCAQIASGDVSTDTPTVQFWYDGKGLANPQQDPYNYAKGKLTKVDNGISASLYMTFDNFGRLTRSQQITDGVTYGDDAHPMTYTYNLSGALTQETYPSGRVVKNDFGSDGDLSRIYSKANASSIEHTYASDFSYTPDGRISQLRLGSGLWEEAKFNTRLQVTELGIGHGVTSPELWKLNYDYGEVDDNGNFDAAKNTGNVGRLTLSFNGLAQPFVQTYKYDPLQRLKEATETSGTGTVAPQTWKETYGYDRYGNRTSHTNFSGTNQLNSTNVTDPTINQNKNRFDDNQGYSYDKNGNLIADAESRGFTFNADNKQTKVTRNGVTVGEYSFDGEGKRVKKVVYDPNGSGAVTEVTVFVYSNGKLIGEYSTAPAAQNPTTNYTATDQLGSPRVITNALGQVVSRRDFRPFGEEITPDTTFRTASITYTSADNVRQKFTGYQKDDETGLDFAEARMYENLHGRFTAVDPLLASGKSANPQSFNRFTYGFNNPLINTDHTGLQVGDWYTPKIPDGVQVPIYVRKGYSPPENYQLATERNRKGDLIYYYGDWKYVAKLNPLGPALMAYPADDPIDLWLECNNFDWYGWDKTYSDEYLDSTPEPTTGLEDASLPFYGMVLPPLAASKAAMEASIVARAATETSTELPALVDRATELHRVLDPIAQDMRTTAIVQTEEGIDIVASSRNTLEAGTA